MESTTTLLELEKLESPFSGRSFITIHMPSAAPINAIITQLDMEINQTEKSTNWKIKGAVLMMLKQIKIYLEASFERIEAPGGILFAVPLNHTQAVIHTMIPTKIPIDIFLYVLDHQFYFDSDYF